MKSEQMNRANITIDGAPVVLSHVLITLSNGTQYHEIAILKKGYPIDVLRSQMGVDEAARWFYTIVNAKPDTQD